MTREEIKAWGQHMADKIFHKKHKELKLNGIVKYSSFGKISIKENQTKIIEFPVDILSNAGFQNDEEVEIIIKSKNNGTNIH